MDTPNPQPSQGGVPAAPAPVPQTPQQSARPAAPAAAHSAPPPSASVKPAAAAAGVKKDEGARNRKLIIGCLSAFGCSLFLFIGVLFAFLLFGSNENPIFGFFGVPSGEVVNVLITLINLIFLVLVFVSFIFVVIGVFKITTARKDDKEARKKGSIFTFASLGIMVLLIMVWITAYFFLASRQTVSPRIAIATTPEKTINLTAPVTIKFDASKAPINRNQFDILSYRWNFGDGATLTGNPQTHTYTDLGNFKVTLTITVKEKATGKDQSVEFTRDVTIQNVLATVIIKVDKESGPAPLMVNFDGSDSKSPNGEITAYAWDLDGDGEFDDGTAATAEKTFDKIGTYTVRLRVTDSTGTFATGELPIEATAPDSPVAVITVEGVTGGALETNKAYIFSAVSSTSPRGTIEKYAWEFADGRKAQTRSVTQSFKEVGDYDVMLEVTDEAGRTGEVTTRFSVRAPESAPLASLKTTPEAVNSTVSGQAPFNVVFDASGSQDSNDNIVEYAWDFDGDGKTDDTNAVTSHTFTAAGNFNVTLTLTDSTNLAATSKVVVQVAAADLTADIKADPVSGVIPLTVRFDASGSSYPDGSIVSYEWNFGDGKPARIDAAKVTYQYTTIGTFTAQVTAISSDNKRATARIPINVRPVPVKACFTSSVQSGKAPLEVEFDPICSTGTVVKYLWKFGDAGQSGDRKPTFTFTGAGEYTVTLEVADSQNVVDTFTQKITVQAQ